MIGKIIFHLTPDLHHEIGSSRSISGLVLENTNTNIELLFAFAVNDSRRAVLRAEVDPHYT